MPVRSFYRAAKRFPPGDRECLGSQDKRGDPPPEYPDHVKQSWDGLSSWDSEEGARQAAKQAPHIGKLIVRYDIPEGIGVTWTPSMDPGHDDLRGDKEALKRCLVADFLAEV